MAPTHAPESMARRGVRQASGFVLLWLVCAASACKLPPQLPAERATQATSAAPGAGDAGGAAEHPTDPHAAGASSPPQLSGAPGLRVLTWNLEWFMDPEHGPRDDDRQLNGARQALLQAGAQLLALQEIGSPAALTALLEAFPSCHGVVSSYTWPQRLALVWCAPLQLLSIHEVTGLDAVGRPPLDARIDDGRGGPALVVIVVHAKAYDDDVSWGHRARFAQGLHAYLAATHAGEPVLIAGDFNDGLLSSITQGRDSPYRVFTDDPGYVTPTAALERRGREPTTARGGWLDHIVLSAALASRLDTASVDVLHDELLARDPSLSATVSDHFPVTLVLR